MPRIRPRITQVHIQIHAHPRPPDHPPCQLQVVLESVDPVLRIHPQPLPHGIDAVLGQDGLERLWLALEVLVKRYACGLFDDEEGGDVCAAVEEGPGCCEDGGK